MNIFNERRAPAGSLKAKLAALAIGDSFPCHDPLERNKYYSIAARLKIRLRCANGTMTRIA